MRCERCYGTGTVRHWLNLNGCLWRDEPCPDCGGTGWAHCCEGERAPPCDDVDWWLDQAEETLNEFYRDEHISSPDCWCEPERDAIDPNVFVHRAR